MKFSGILHDHNVCTVPNEAHGGHRTSIANGDHQVVPREGLEFASGRRDSDRHGY